MLEDRLDRRGVSQFRPRILGALVKPAMGSNWTPSTVSLTGGFLKAGSAELSVGIVLEHLSYFIE